MSTTQHPAKIRNLKDRLALENHLLGVDKTVARSFRKAVGNDIRAKVSKGLLWKGDPDYVPPRLRLPTVKGTAIRLRQASNLALMEQGGLPGMVRNQLVRGKAAFGVAKNIGSGLFAVFQKIASAGLGVITAFTGLAAASVALVTNLLQRGAEAESLRRGYSAVGGPNIENKLRQISREPGINFTQSAQGFVKLRGAVS